MRPRPLLKDRALRLTLAPVLTAALPLLLTGCLAVAAGAAGGAAVSTDSGMDDVRYYVKTEDPPQRIAAAMLDKEVVTGMTPPQVRLVMGARSGYASTPTIKETTEGRDQERWVFDGSSSRHPSYEVVFEDGTVTSHGELS